MHAPNTIAAKRLSPCPHCACAPPGKAGLSRDVRLYNQGVSSLSCRIGFVSIGLGIASAVATTVAAALGTAADALGLYATVASVAVGRIADCQGQ